MKNEESPKTKIFYYNLAAKMFSLSKRIFLPVLFVVREKYMTLIKQVQNQTVDSAYEPKIKRYKVQDVCMSAVFYLQLVVLPVEITLYSRPVQNQWPLKY